MAVSRAIPWARIAAEGAVIVASILLALAVDAWWAERVERNSEREELSRLHSEFELNRNRILRSGNSPGPGTQQRAATASLQLYGLLQDALHDGSTVVSLSDSLLMQLLNSPTFEADTPIFDGLVRSGRIEIIKSRNIVAALSTWERLLRNASEQEQRARRFVDDQLVPGLIEAGPVGHIFLNQYRPTREFPLEPGATTDIPVSGKITDLVAQRYFQISVAVDMLERTRDAADAVLAAIEESLEET